MLKADIAGKMANPAMMDTEMFMATIDIPEEENRILNIVKGKYGFKNKEEALIFILRGFMENLEPEIRPEYLNKLKKIEKENRYGKIFSSVKELDDYIKSNA